MAATEQKPLSNLPQLIPEAVFMEDVKSFVEGRTAEEVLNELRGAHQKYKYIEAEIVQRKKRLAFKQPEIRKCLDAVTLLLAQHEAGEQTVLDFSLSDQVYARARLAEVSSVNLWLGAGVMLEYSLQDAKELLERQLAGCKQQLEVVQWEHDYIKDQLTTMEVSMARVAPVVWLSTLAAATPHHPAMATAAHAVPHDDGGSLLKGLQDMPSPTGPTGKLQYLPSPALLTMLSPPPVQPHNLMGGGGGWGASGVTPLNLPQLGLGLTPTPGTIPCLPLVSPGSTSALGLAALGLGGCTPGRALEQLHVATDPLSLNCVKVNMLTVDVDEATMDQLMDEGRPHRPCLLTPGQLAHGRTALASNPIKSSSPGGAASPLPLFVPVAGAGAPATVRLSLGGTSRRSLCGTKRPAGPSSAGRPPSGIGAGKIFPHAAAATSDTTASLDGSGSARSTATPPDHELAGPAASGSGSGSGSRPTSAGRSSGTAGGGKEEGEGGPRLDLSVKFLEDNGYFDITLQAAAVQLGVGVTTLKKLCRQNGLGRWPYRARCSLRKLRDKMREYFATAPQEEREAADALMEREFGRLAQLNEGVIDDAVKQFRQAMFKLEFKARQQLESAARAAGKRPGSASSEGDLQAVIHSDPAIRTQAMLHLRRLLAACLDE
ncbi:Prefoldin subunit 3 [Chlorella sorokiniana]|uniref:Prefoldin subunit 3 n=1 Tax=Chlorella sorokiniana TaxID=3076 RepID=A0A2P6TRQ7_CHLSO|nr:Prefoldin subunit 3 [Chlorella sorokiniana]|eukprot:PRW56744.1 Prefoldin subunit 3 [Chlorella sorokiniana]